YTNANGQTTVSVFNAPPAPGSSDPATSNRQNLILNWQLDGNPSGLNGNPINDSSGLANNGSLNSTNGATWDVGEVGGALRLTTANTLSGTLGNATNTVSPASFSVSFW